jgi:hypothetical protein
LAYSSPPAATGGLVDRSTWRVRRALQWIEHPQHLVITHRRVRTDPTAVTPRNIEEVFARHGVPEELDVLSIDVDTIDYWIWAALGHYRPRLVVVEYNASLSHEEALVFPNDETARWDETSYYGSSLGAFRQLAAVKGYQLVHTEMSGTNAFFVRSDLSDLVDVSDPPMRSTNFGQSVHGCHQTRYIASGNIWLPVVVLEAGPLGGSVTVLQEAGLTSHRAAAAARAPALLPRRGQGPCRQPPPLVASRPTGRVQLQQPGVPGARAG